MLFSCETVSPNIRLFILGLWRVWPLSVPQMSTTTLVAHKLSSELVLNPAVCVFQQLEQAEVAYHWISSHVPRELVTDARMRRPYSLSPDAFEVLYACRNHLYVTQLLCGVEIPWVHYHSPGRTNIIIDQQAVAAMAIYCLLEVINDEANDAFRAMVCMALVKGSVMVGRRKALQWLRMYWPLVRRCSSPNFPLSDVPPPRGSVCRWQKCLEYIVMEQTGMYIRAVGPEGEKEYELRPLSFWSGLGIDVRQYCHWYHFRARDLHEAQSALNCIHVCGVCWARGPGVERLCVRQGGRWVCQQCREHCEPLDMPSIWACRDDQG